MPTNGFWPDVIAERTKKFLTEHSDVHLRVNISIDGFEETHDSIRGVGGSYRRAMASLDTLREMRKIMHKDLHRH